MKTKKNSSLFQLKRGYILVVMLMFSSMQVFSQLSQSLWVGESYTFDVSSSVLGLTANVSWSTNGGYLSLSGSGFYRNIKVTQYFSGTATVTCEWDYKLTGNGSYTHVKRYVNITCKNNQVSISPTSMTLSPGQTSYVRYSHQFTNEYTSNANAYFQSTNPSVATVDQNTGKVTAIAPGTAYVNVYSKISAGAPYCLVTVKNVDPTLVSIPSNLTVYVGEDSKITPSLQPSDAQTTFTWYTLDSSVATVSGGTVKGIDEGSTQVYCVTANGKQSNMCNVQVYYRVPTGIDVSPTSAAISLHESKQLSYAVKPSNAKTTVTWQSEDVNEKVIKLSSSGLVTPVAAGTARVYAETDNGYKDYCTITVLPDPTKISIPAKILLMYGDSRTITYKLEPSNAFATLSWTSDNPKVVKVNSQGKIEGKAGGSANITVETHNGNTATCRVEVPEPDYRLYVWLNDGTSVSYPLNARPKVTFSDENVSLDGSGINAEFALTDFNRFTLTDDMVCPMPSSIDMPASLSLMYGDTYQIPYTLQPNDYDFNTTLQWTSTDDNVVIVSNSGMLQAVGGGDADIIVKASNGCKAICHINVPDPEFYLVIWLNDGRKTIIHLKEKPMLRYDADVFTLISQSTEAEYNATDIRKITLANNSSGESSGVIKAPITEDREQISMQDSEMMVISGSNPGAVTIIYATSGLLLGTFRADEGGNTYIPMSQLPAGVLIIKSETITFKIIKK